LARVFHLVSTLKRGLLQAISNLKRKSVTLKREHHALQARAISRLCPVIKFPHQLSDSNINRVVLHAAIKEPNICAVIIHTICGGKNPTALVWFSVNSVFAHDDF
jgi:hypothetical protein